MTKSHFTKIVESAISLDPTPELNEVDTKILDVIRLLFLNDFSKAIDEIEKLNFAKFHKSFFTKMNIIKAYIFSRMNKQIQSEDLLSKNLKQNIEKLTKDWDGIISLIHLTNGNLTGNLKIEEGEKALKIFEQTENSYFMCLALSKLGLAYNLKGDKQYSIELLLRAIHYAQKMSLTHYVASFHSQIGWIYSEMGRFEDAIIQFNQSIEYSGDDFNAITTYINLGTIYHRQGKQYYAINNYQLALDIAKELNEVRLIPVICDSIANVYLFLNKLELAQSSILLADEYIENNEDVLGIEQLYQTQGLIYFKQNEIEKAIKSLHRSIEHAEKFQNTRGKFSGHLHLGSVYLMSGEIDKAEKNYQTSLKIAKNTEYSYGLATAYHEMSLQYFRIGDFSRSRKLAEKGINYCSSNKIGNVLIKLHLLNAEVLIFQDKKQEAMDNIQAALLISENNNYVRIKIQVLSALIYQMAMKYVRAEELFEEAYMQLNLIDDYDLWTTVIFHLINIKLLSNNRENIGKLLDELKSLSDKISSNDARVRYLVSMGRYLNSSDRLAEKIKAIDYFERAAEFSDLSADLRLIVSLELCEIYIYEYSIEKSKRILDKISQLIEYLVLDTHASPIIEFEAHLLQTRSLFLDGKIEESFEILKNLKSSTSIKSKHELNKLEKLEKELNSKLIEMRSQVEKSKDIFAEIDIDAGKNYLRYAKNFMDLYYSSIQLDTSNRDEAI